MGSETEPKTKEFVRKPPQAEDALRRAFSLIRDPGGSAWPKRLQLNYFPEQEIPKPAEELGKALVGLAKKTLPRLLEERRKIGKEGLNGSNGRLTENPLLKPPSRLVLPDGQQILTLSEIGTEILGLVINASNQSLDLSDKKLEYSHPEFFSKGNTARFRVQVSRLRNKLSKLGWSIQTVDFITGPNGRRGKLELRKIKNPDNNSENKESASRSTEPVQQKPQPIDDSSLPAQEPVATPTVPTELPRGGTIADFSDNGNGASPKRELPEKSYHVAHRSKEAEKITKSITYEILAHLAEGTLHRIRTSHIKILQSALAGKGIREAFGITTKAELDEYFISFLMENLEKLWDIKSANSLSIEELRIQGGLATLRNANYTKEKIEEILRFHFAIPAPAPAEAQAN